MSSDITLSSAKQTAASNKTVRKAATILEIIFTRHCTPVERVEKSGLVPPPGLHADVQVQIDPDAEEPLHLRARQRAYLLQHGALGADDDGLLAVALHADGGEDAREPRRFFPLVDCDGDGVRHLLAGGQ